VIATDVMAEIGDALAPIEGLRVYIKPRARIDVPALLVPLPKIRFDQTYGRGQDEFEFDLVLIGGPASDRETGAVVLSRYTAGAGEFSIKAALDAYEWETCSEVTATDFEFSDISYNEVEYAGGVFATVAIGSGG
jgi:hypothetical protein